MAGLRTSAPAPQATLSVLIAQTGHDNGILAAPRMPEAGELERLFEDGYVGKQVDLFLHH